MIGRSGKGYATRIAFDLNDPMGESSCVTCGECVAACPTGALTNKPIRDVPIQPRSELDPVQTRLPVLRRRLRAHLPRGPGARRDRVRRGPRAARLTEPAVRQGPLRLGLRGLAAAAHRAADPARGLLSEGRAVRRRARRRRRLAGAMAPIGGAAGTGGPAGTGGAAGTGGRRGRRSSGDGRSSKKRRKPGGLVDYDEVLPHFREATWDEALDLVARRLSEIHADGGPAGIAGFGSAKCSNEEAYLFQKLIRTGFHTNNVDHCTRLCHASSVAALFEGIGSGAVSTTYGDVVNADVVIITGSNPTANHPVASSFFKQARRNGTTIIYVDPRADKMCRPRRHLLPAQAGHRRGVLQRGHARGDPARADRPRTSSPRGPPTTTRWRRPSPDYPPERGRADHRGARRRDPPGRPGLGRGGGRDHLLGHGHLPAHHRHRQRALPDRDVRDHRQRRQARHRAAPAARAEQRAGRVGRRADPDVLPRLPVGRRRRRHERFEQAWGAAPGPGARAHRHRDHRLGRSRAACAACTCWARTRSCPTPTSTRSARRWSALDFLVVQDIFLTETAEFADVILPASSYLEKDGTYTNTDRRVQLGRKVLDAAGAGAGGLGDHPGHRPPDRARLVLHRRRARSSTRSCR